MKLRANFNQGHRLAGQGQFHTQRPANVSRADNADSHCTPPSRNKPLCFIKPDSEIMSSIFVPARMQYVEMPLPLNYRVYYCYLQHPSKVTSFGGFLLNQHVEVIHEAEKLV